MPFSCPILLPPNPSFPSSLVKPVMETDNKGEGQFAKPQLHHPRPEYRKVIWEQEDLNKWHTVYLLYSLILNYLFILF